MTLDELEKAASKTVARGYTHDSAAPVLDLARAVLAMLPVVRAAIAHEATRKECQRTGRHHGMLVLASEMLEDAVDAISAALEST